MNARLKPIIERLNVVSLTIYGTATAALGVLFLILGIVISNWILLTIGFTFLLLGFIAIAIHRK